MSRDVHPTANQKRRWKQVNKEIFSPFLIFFFFVLFCFFFVFSDYSNSTQLILTNQFYGCTAPEGPPQDLVIRQLNSSSSLVKWNEPAASQRNGVITGYQVRHNL